jgi:uncharacterized protein YbjT (DUF2867 family)
MKGFKPSASISAVAEAPSSVSLASHSQAAIRHWSVGEIKDDADATSLVTATAKAGTPPMVYPSIDSFDRFASRGQTMAKLEAERTIEDSDLPWTNLREIQFYDYCFDNSRKLARFRVVAQVPVAPVAAGFTVQPVDTDEVAAHLVELTLGEPIDRIPNMAGPQTSKWVDLFLAT